MNAKRYQSLDGLRGVCALSVLLFHADDMFRKGTLLAHGYIAVDMFFILSGFVIALTYEDRLKAGLGMRAFLLARGQRLLPIFWLGASLNIMIFIAMASAGYYPLGYTQAMIWIAVPVLTMLMIPAFGMPGDAFSPALNVTWSLLIEWLINFAYASGIFRCSTRTLVLLAMFGWLGMAIAGYGTGMGWCAGGTRYDVFTYGLLRGAPAFLTGVVLFRLHRQSLFAGLPVFSTGLLITLWLCIAVVPTFTATPTFDWIAVTLFCPLLVALLIRSDHRMPAFARILGTLSYPLYTVHPGIILLAQRTPIFGLNRGPHPLRAICVVILCVAAAWAVRSLSDIRRPRTAVDVTQSA